MAFMTCFSYVVLVPSLVLVTVPLAIGAIITTTLAFAVLTVRLGMVYVAMGSVLIPEYFFPPSEPRYQPIERIPSFRSTTSISNFQLSTVRRRARRLSQSSRASSTASVTSPPMAIAPSQSFDLSQPQSIGAERDYEGMGGWRLPLGKSHSHDASARNNNNDDDDDDDDDSIWTKFNARLQLPGDYSARVPRRYHQRAMSANGTSHGGRADWGVFDLHHSPESQTPVDSRSASRARTPTPIAPQYGFDGYFAQPFGAKTTKKSPSLVSSSPSSRSSGGLTMKYR